MVASDALIEPGALYDLLRQNGTVRTVDASFAMPGSIPGPKDVFDRKRIGDAVFFDIDRIADPHTDLPHMLPSPAAFEDAVSGMGIGNDDLLVIYDQTGIAMAAARVWWTFRVFGHDNVRVLNGGLPGWEAAGYPVNTAPPRPPSPSTFKARFRPGLVSTLQDVQHATSEKDSLILDARSPQRFSGTMPEPRPGLRSGHIPGSVNLPFTNLLDPSGHRLKSKDALEKEFQPFGDSTPLIASCGSGVTACVIALAACRIGRRDVSVYDGSWAEWGQVR